MAKLAVKLPKKLCTNPKFEAYMKKQPPVPLSLKDIQKSLSHIGVSLSKRIIQDREKR